MKFSASAHKQSSFPFPHSSCPESKYNGLYQSTSVQIYISHTLIGLKPHLTLIVHDWGFKLFFKWRFSDIRYCIRHHHKYRAAKLFLIQEAFQYMDNGQVGIKKISVALRCRIRHWIGSNMNNIWPKVISTHQSYLLQHTEWDTNS